MEHTHLDTVRTYYPNALPAEDAVKRLHGIIGREYGFHPHQLLYADSLCGDDANAIQYPESVYKMLGPFKLGGIGGYPFAGLMGMAAFASHVPDDGAVVIFHAPHIGITKEGKLGEVSRAGQATRTFCCGAAQVGLQRLMNEEITAGTMRDSDYQMSALEQLLLRNTDRIKASDKPIFTVTDILYDTIEKQMDHLIANTEFPCRYVFQVGGVYINGDHDMGGFFAYRRIKCRDLESETTQDLLERF